MIPTHLKQHLKLFFSWLFIGTLPTKDWDTSHEHYNTFFSRLSSLYTDALVQYDSNDHYAYFKRRRICYVNTSKMTNMMSNPEVHKGRMMMIHMPIFSSELADSGHSVLITLDPITRTQFIFDGAASWATDFIPLLAPIIPEWSVKVVASVPSAEYSLQHLLSTAGGVQDACGLVCILVGVLSVYSGMNLQEAYDLVYASYKKPSQERHNLLRACAGWYQSTFVEANDSDPVCLPVHRGLFFGK